MHRSLSIQAPVARPAQLFLLFHGVGADEHDLEPLGRFLAAKFPTACVLSIGGSEAADFGGGRQWFSLREIDDTQRPLRVAAALPEFLATIRHWQEVTGVGPAATALVGFSQGAIMALAAAAEATPPCGRVIAIGGRFARLPESVASELTIHLIHGKADPVMPYAHTVAAAEHLIPLGADLTADVLPYLGHAIDDEVLELIHRRLTTHVPRRLWEAAMRSGE